MHIGIDASRANKKQKTGVEWYAYHLIENLKKIDRKNQYFLYTNEKLEGDLEICPSNFQKKLLKWPIKYLWTQLRLSYEMKWGKNKPDLLFVPAHTLPILHPRKSVVTVHDVGFKKYPKMYNWKAKLYHYWSTWFIKNHTTKIITVSQFSKKEIIKYYKIESERIAVIYNGFNQESYRSIDDKSTIKDVLEKYHINQPYFLNIARLENKKNILGLIQGFKIFQDKEKKYKLVLIGNRRQGYKKIIQEINNLNLNNEVIILGWVGEKELPYLLNGSTAFVFPSFYEGFGIPVLEAMACGTPVLCSDIEPLREVASDAVLYFNPNNPQEIAEKMQEIISNSSLVQNLKQKGFEQIKKFSWKKCARETLEVIETTYKIS